MTRRSARARWASERVGEDARRSKVRLTVDVDRALVLACRLKHGRFRAGCNPRGVPLRLRLRFRQPIGEAAELGSTSKDQHPAGPQLAPGGAPWPPATSTASCSPAT
jgi:hypothetical protein